MPLLLFLALSQQQTADAPPDLPFSDDDAVDPTFGADPDPLPDADPTPAPGPTPTPIQGPPALRDVFGGFELACGGLILSYAAVYLIGRASIRQKLAQLTAALLPSLLRHFAFASRFTQQNAHLHRSWMTGRVGYRGAIVSADFKYACDPLGIIYSVLRNQRDKLVLEFVLLPPHEPSGIVHVNKAVPSFSDRLELNAYPVGNGYSLWTDFGAGAERFVTAVKQFIRDYPTAIETIELSNVNRFCTRVEGNFVARFELRVIGTISTFVNDDWVDFCVNLTDLYCGIRLPPEVQQRNEALRKKLAEDKKDESQTGKKQVEEDSKAQKKRTKPKIKAVHQ